MANAKKVLRVSVLPLVIGFLGQLRFENLPVGEYTKKDSYSISNAYCYDFPKLESLTITEKKYTPFLDKDFLGFKEALAFKESQGRYQIINKYGYLGKYQFGAGTLALVGIKDTHRFLNSPQLQEQAFIANLSRNKWILRRDIQKYAGKYMNGVLITESGILAAAHLSGPGSVKNFLRSDGAIRFEDAFGTSILDYMKKFKSYDVSIIKPNQKAKAS